MGSKRWLCLEAGLDFFEAGLISLPMQVSSCVSEEELNLWVSRCTRFSSGRLRSEQLDWLDIDLLGS
jgi:hypothetical protein